MDREEWTDIVARMTPEQRKAMAYFAEAVADRMERQIPMEKAMRAVFPHYCGYGATMLNKVYPYAITDGSAA